MFLHSEKNIIYNLIYFNFKYLSKIHFCKNIQIYTIQFELTLITQCILRQLKYI